MREHRARPTASASRRCRRRHAPLLRRRSSPSRARSGVTVAGSSVGDEPAAEHHLRSCRTGRSARRGRRRSAAPRARRAGPSRSRSQMAAWAPTSTPRVGCEAMSSRGRAAHLPADDELLLVAAGQRGGEDLDARRADVVLARRSARCPRGRPRGRSAALGVGRLGLVARACGSPRAAPRAAARAGAGPPGCSRCRASRRCARGPVR